MYIDILIPCYTIGAAVLFIVLCCYSIQESVAPVAKVTLLAIAMIAAAWPLTLPTLIVATVIHRHRWPVK